MSDAARIVAAIEEFMDAKVAFAGMTPEIRRMYCDALQHKRQKAVKVLSEELPRSPSIGTGTRRD